MQARSKNSLFRASASLSRVMKHEMRMDPCSDPEFELHNHIDYARAELLLGVRLIAD